MSLGWIHTPLPECAGQPHPGLKGSGQGVSSPMWLEEISLVSSENIALCLLRDECLKMCGRSRDQFSQNASGTLCWGRVGMWLHKELCTVEAWDWSVQWDGSSLGVQEVNGWLGHFSWLLQGPGPVSCAHPQCFQKGILSSVRRAGAEVPQVAFWIPTQRAFSVHCASWPADF